MPHNLKSNLKRTVPFIPVPFIPLFALFPSPLFPYTLYPAYASFEEKSKGSLTPGKLADLIVLNNDITKIEPEEILNIKVVMTIIDGKIVWEIL